ncbi:MAG: hypothetical protein QM501_09125, partial [Gimesia sp.]
MAYRLLIFLGVLLITNFLIAEEIEIQLKSTAAIFQRHIARLAKEGYSLTDVSVYPGNRYDQFAAIARKMSEPKAWKSHYGLSSQQLEKKLKQYASEGFQPVVISGYDRKGTARYA